MARKVDLVYDRLVAGDKLRSSDKYEVLAAIVFALLDQQVTIHDMRLLGSSGVRHQIDVVVSEGEERRRVLVECKDYDKRVGLPLVRNFWGAVEDITPNQAFMVTTEGYTRPAQTYAAAKGIRLAVLRPPESEDLENRVQQIHFELRMTVPVEDPHLEFLVPQDQTEALARSPRRGHVHIEEAELRYADGTHESMEEVLRQHLAAPPLGGAIGQVRTMSGEVQFDPPAFLRVTGRPELRITGLRWRQRWTVAVDRFSTGLGIGGLTAELVLRTLDGEIHRIFTNRQLAAWTIDSSGQVTQRA